MTKTVLIRTLPDLLLKIKKGIFGLELKRGVSIWNTKS